MASSGSIISDTWNKAYWSFEWTSTPVSPGVTKVSWNLYGRGRSTSPTIYTTKIRLNINGSQVFEMWDKDASFASRKHASGSFNVTHNNIGVGTFSVYMLVTKIYEALDSIGSPQTITLDDNKRETVLFTFPSVFTDEEVPFNIQYENKVADELLSISAGITSADRREIIPLHTIATNENGAITSGIYSFDFRDEIEKLYNEMTTTSSANFYLTLKEEFNGYFGTYNHVVTAQIVNAEPTFDPQIVDINQVTTNLTGDPSKFILGYSDASVSFNEEAKKKATVASKTVVDNNTNKILLSGNDGTINQINSSSLNFQVIDSRGLSVLASKNLNTVPYFKPYCQIRNVVQKSSTSFTVTMEGQVFYDNFGKMDNNFIVKYRYKNMTLNEEYCDWIELTPTINAENFVYSFDINVTNVNQSYAFQVYITDYLQDYYSNAFVYTTGLEPVLKVKDANNIIHSLGIIKGQTRGKSSYELAKESGFTGTEQEFISKLLNPQALPIGSIYTSFEKTDPGSIFGGTWEPIVDTFIYGRGTSYALNSTGGEATHKLTVAEMPAHTHGASYTTTASNGSATYRYLKRTSLASYSTKPTTPTKAVGGNVAHENMPPYVVAYAWQRVG